MATADPLGTGALSASPTDVVLVPAAEVIPLPGCGDVDLVNGDIAIIHDRSFVGGDFDELRDLSGVAGARAVVEGTVIGHSGFRNAVLPDRIHQL